jgi:hypothetical protein
LRPAPFAREVTETRGSLGSAWANYAPQAPPLAPDLGPDQIDAVAWPDAPNELHFAKLETAKQEPIGLGARAASVSASERSRTTELESQAKAAEQALLQWRESVGAELEALLKHLSTTFADLPPAATAGATEAYRAAHAHVQRELSRLCVVLRADENATKEIASISEQIAKTRARDERLSRSLDRQPDQLNEELEARISRGDLVGVITTLLPHIVDNTCPVCQRDYSEISEESLADHPTLRLAELNSAAKRLQSILATVREASADERRLIARLTDLQQSQLSPEVRLEYRRRFLDLTQSEGRLEAISTRVDEGDTVIRAELATRIALIDLRNNNSRIADIRRAVTQLCTTLEQPPVTDSEPAEQAISRLTSYVLGLQLSSKLHPSSVRLSLLGHESPTARRRAERSHSCKDGSPPLPSAPNRAASAEATWRRCASCHDWLPKPAGSPSLSIPSTATSPTLTIPASLTECEVC